MRYVTIKNIKQGMVLARPLLDEEGNILLNKGGRISPVVYNRIDKMDVQGLYVDDEISQDIEIEDIIPPELKRNAVKALIKQDYRKAVQYANNIVDGLRLKKSLQVNLIDIKNNKNYTYKHCVSTCVYSVIIGLAMGLTEENLRSLAVAAMFHDIGKFDLPEHILHKKTELTDEEVLLVKQHPRTGYDKVSELPEISSVSRNAVLYHHENVDGTGYYGLPEEKQTVVTKIVHLADVYDALTSIRKHREAFSPGEAMEYIMGNAGTMFDREVVAAFVSRFPVYPIGATIRLSNNEQAVVCSNERNSIRPVICTLQGNLVDLSTDPMYRNVIIIGLD